MSRLTKLSGWNISVEKVKRTAPGGNGQGLKEIEIFVLAFTEVQPPTGDQIVFECDRQVADFIVERITGIALPGIHIPKL